MNKILTKPSITSIFTFICAFIATLIVNNLFLFKHFSFENALIILSLLFSGIYGYYIEERLSRIYRIKYMLYLSLFYIILSFLFSYLQVDLTKYLSMIKYIALFSFKHASNQSLIFYLFGGTISNSLANYKKNKIKGITPEKREKMKIVLIIVFSLIIFLNVITELCKHKTMIINPMLLPIILLSVLFIIIFHLKMIKYK